MMEVINISALSRFQESDIKQAKEYISHNTFPEQDEEKFHKLIKVRFKSEEEREVYERFSYDATFKKYRSNSICPWFLILRCDKVKPFMVIMINNFGQIVVGNTSNLEGILNPPGYDSSSSIPSKIFEGYEVLELPNAKTDEEYRNSVKNEFVWLFPLQDYWHWSGMKVKSEYHKDILEMDYKETDYHLRNKPMEDDKIIESLIQKDPDLEKIPPNGLLTFPYYYPKHLQDCRDIPLRAINNGIVILADSNAPDPYLVIMEEREDGIYFVTQREAHFYTDISEFESFETIRSDDIIKMVLERIK